MEAKFQISVALYELKNMITIGTIIIQNSIDRNDNRGGFVKFKLSN
jgi:L-aspartate oxidase